MLDQGWALLLTAVVAGVASIIVAVIQQFRRENHADHAKVMDALNRVSNTMERVEGRRDRRREIFRWRSGQQPFRLNAQRAI